MMENHETDEDEGEEVEETSCLVCGKNDNYPEILLCDGCDGEYHMYCLQPPLETVPENDWFCGTYF